MALIIGIVAVLIIIFGFLCYKKAPPTEAIVVTGFGLSKPKVVSGKGTFVLPVLQRADKLNMRLLKIDVKTPETGVKTQNGVSLWIDSVVTIQVYSENSTVLDDEVKASGLKDAKAYVMDDGSLQKCIISGYEVFDLNNASDEIEYPNDTTQLRKEKTCERIYIYNSQDEYDAAVKNREDGQAILNGEEAAPERCVILNGSIVPNLQYEVGDDGKIRISMRDLANAYSSKTIYSEESHILYVPMVYQNTAKFPTKDTPQSALDDLNISEVVNPDEGTFTYTSTISMDLWNDTFELPQDDTYMMPIEHISRILGWEFWTGDNVLKIVSDELDDTNPDNFVIDTTVREETCYDVGTGEEIACD